MADTALAPLRAEIDKLNLEILALLSRRAEVAERVRRAKSAAGAPMFDPLREQQMLQSLVERNQGPFAAQTVAHLFKEIFKATASLMEHEQATSLRVLRTAGRPDARVRVGKVEFGGPEPVLLAGPCSVESEIQIEDTARFLVGRGVRLLRGGAFKPRTSPYDFQGLGEEGLRLLSAAATRHGMACVTEVVDTRHVELVSRFADMLQVGSRNMHNFELLKEVGRTRKPILLKRGLSATIDELLGAAEYIVSSGNPDVVLCERGIRTFEQQTRNTLDISAVALLRRMTALPVIVDVSHAAGRKDILAPLARAGIAAGAQGVMIEVHPCPEVARSDSRQQLDFAEFDRFVNDLSIASWVNAGAL